MSKTLQLSLKTRWFEMTKAGIKTEDYREITPLFANRFMIYNRENRPIKWWKKEFFEFGDLEEIAENLDIFCNIKPFITNIMTLGYPKSTDTSRILHFEHKGIEIRTGNPEWGAEPDKLYFVIKHGAILENTP